MPRTARDQRARDHVGKTTEPGAHGRQEPRNPLGRTMKIRCPITSAHFLVEVAPALWQCPHCGYGPSTSGHRPYWALSSLEEDDGVVEGISVRYDAGFNSYIMSGVTWKVGDDGVKLPGSFVEAGSARLSVEDLENAPLPVVILAKGKWALPTNKPKLKEGMFLTSLGLKEISLSAGRGCTSG